jgi:hypothetical protein
VGVAYIAVGLVLERAQDRRRKIRGILCRVLRVFESENDLLGGDFLQLLRNATLSPFAGETRSFAVVLLWVRVPVLVYACRRRGSGDGLGSWKGATGCDCEIGAWA